MMLRAPRASGDWRVAARLPTDRWVVSLVAAVPLVKRGAPVRGWGHRSRRNVSEGSGPAARLGTLGHGSRLPDDARIAAGALASPGNREENE